MQQSSSRNAPTATNTSRPRSGSRLLWGAALPAVFLALLMLGGQPFTMAPAHANHPVSSSAPGSSPSTAPTATRLGSSVRYGTVELSPGPHGAFLVPGAAGPVPSVAGSRSSSGPSPAVHPSTGGSTASNWVVANQTDPSSIVQVGGSNSTLVLASASSADLNNGSITLPGLILTPSVYFFKYGYSSVYRSTDGGKSWHTTWVPINGSWTGNGSFYSGETGLGVNQIVGSGSGGATGGKLFGVETFEETCLADYELLARTNFAAAAANCTSAANATAPMGIALTESVDGGQSWGAARPLAYADPYTWQHIPTIGACTGGYTWFTGNYTDDPHISYSQGSGVVLVSWINDSYDLFNFTCMNGQFYAEFGLTSTVWQSISTNGGASFSAAAAVSDNAAFSPFLSVARQLNAYSDTAIGPGPTYPVYRIWNDLANSTSSTIPFSFSSSTNNGTSFSAPTDIGNLGIYPVFSAAPGSFANWSGPDLVADNWSGSPYQGNLYLFWNDNQTTPPGYPSIAFSESTDGGTTWSDVVYLSPQVPSTTRFFQPSASVAPNGEIWVEYYGESLSTNNNGAGILTGSYSTYGVYSTNGGSTWSPQFPISDTASFIESAGTAAATSSLGSGPSLVATTNGTYAAWFDCRGVSCPGVGIFPTPSAYVTELHPVGLSSNAPIVNETLNVFGSSTTFALPSSAVLETGASIGVSVPPWEPDTTTSIYAFQNYSGFASSISNPATLSYPGSGSLSVNFLPEPAGWIAGTIGPVGAGLTLTVNGNPVSLVTPFNATADSFNATIAAGFSYTVLAIRAGFTTYSQSVPTQSGRTTPQTIWLPRESGWISGKLTPANATLLVNESAIAVSAMSGAFNDSVPWGQYWVNASESGYTSFTQYVTVSPEQTSPVSPTLSGGWITGAISPLTGTVWVNGVAVNLLSGNFNVSEPGGTYTLTATAHGYSFFHWTIVVTPGHSSAKDISLTNQGWIVGSVGPSAALGSALVYVAGKQVSLSPSGTFNATEGAGAHTVQVSATGYNTSSLSPTVTPGNVSYANFTLNPSSTVQNCTVTNTCKNTGPPSNASTSNSNLLLYAGIGIVLLIVVVAAALLLMRRRRPPTSEEGAPPSEPAAYDESVADTGSPPS